MSRATRRHTKHLDTFDTRRQTAELQGPRQHHKSEMTWKREEGCCLPVFAGDELSPGRLVSRLSQATTAWELQRRTEVGSTVCTTPRPAKPLDGRTYGDLLPRNAAATRGCTLPALINRFIFISPRPFFQRYISFTRD